MNDIFDETEEEKEQREGESFWDFAKSIIIFMLVILIIGGLLMAWADSHSKPYRVPTDDELYQDWVEQNYTPRYDKP